MVGIDAARGFALIGMFAVHLMPAYNEDADRATAAWMIFAGNASALFAVLAGIALAFMTGGATPYTGDRMRRATVKIAARALLLGLLTLVINSVDLPVYNILGYMALMFLLMIPLLRLPRVVLLVLGGGMTLLMPVVRYVLHVLVGAAGYHPNPSFVDMFTDPLGVLSTLSITGVYPALTWWGFMCLGAGIGRFALQRAGSRLALIVTGLLVYAVTTAVSYVLVMQLGGYEIISSAFPGATEDEVDEFVVFGPIGQLPTGGPGWLLAAAPHSNTPFALLIGTGFSLAAIGIFIFLSRSWSALLRPLIDAGSMSTTLYVSHLVFVATMPDTVPGEALFTIQALAALLFAMMWKVVSDQGPVEIVMAKVARAVSTAAVPEKESAPRGR
ncbi:heparan-alpha-glucosaminide N-acetyltransferase domain-containing protein [Brevibacterium yomogidense]|uniref:heparan-alpha-glucosaminide N-acetyltransferase domain-containing protein n=1 Tax=Brevibacterium yomogidense TaxID=946573 RepID=UPI002FCCEF30